MCIDFENIGMNISKYLFEAPDIQLFWMTITLGLIYLISEEGAIFGLALKNSNLYYLLQLNIPVLLITFRINIFRSQILFCFFDVSLIIDYQVDRLRSLFDVHSNS